MYSKKIGFIALAVLALVLLPACTRSASQAPLATPTLEAGIVQPAAATPAEGMELIQQIATQTAMAGGGQPEAGGTPAPADANTTPVSANVTPVDANTTPVVAISTLPPLSGQAATNTPLPSPTPQVISQPVSAPGTYTLQYGEFPYCIARRFNVDPDELLRANGLVDSQILQPGLVLTIPSGGKPFPGPRALISHPATYTALSGDTIYGIACKFGDVDPMAIANANGLTAPYKLTPGTQLQIP